MKAEELERDYLTSYDLSGWLGVSRRTLFRWVRLRKGPPSIKVGRSVYYRRTAVQRWLLSLEGGSHAGATVARDRK